MEADYKADYKSNQIWETEYEKHKSLKIEGRLEGAQSGMTFADMQ